MDLEKEDDNLDYGTYYSTDGDKWTDVTEVREDLNGKKNVFFWALPESPTPPPDLNSGNLVLFFRTSKFKI